MTAIRTFFQEFWNRIPQIGVNDIIDILIVAFLFYTVMRLIRSTSAARIARSILLLLVVTGLTEIFKLYTLNWILSKILEIGVIALVIMFQPELRRMLERFGGRFFSNLISSSGSASPEQQAIEATVAACEVMSKEKVGALLIFERSMPLDEYFKTGTIIDAKVTDQLRCRGRDRLGGDGHHLGCHRRHAQAPPCAADARKAPDERADFGAGDQEQSGEELVYEPFQNEAGTT